MTWVAWLDKATGEARRVAHLDEPTPEFSESTHDRVELTEEQYEAVKAGQSVDRNGTVKAPPRPPVKSAQEIDADIARSKQTAAQQYLARLPPGVIDLLADLVAQRIAGK